MNAADIQRQLEECSDDRLYMHQHMEGTGRVRQVWQRKYDAIGHEEERLMAEAEMLLAYHEAETQALREILERYR